MWTRHESPLRLDDASVTRRTTVVGRGGGHAAAVRAGVLIGDVQAQSEVLRLRRIGHTASETPDGAEQRAGASQVMTQR